MSSWWPRRCGLSRERGNYLTAPALCRGRAMRRLSMRHFTVTLVVITLVTCLAAPGMSQPAAPPAAGQMTWAVHFTLAPRWLDPAESEGSITPFLTLYAVHDALLKPMPGAASANSLAQSWTRSPHRRRLHKADARRRLGQQPRRVVDRLAQRPRLRLQPARQRALPQRRASDRGGRGTLPREL